MSTGWIKIHREIQEHWIWQDEKYLKWWFTIVLNVNHEAKKFPVGTKLFICNPGQSFRSIEQWTDMFSCSKPTTLKFFEMLKNDDMIQTEIVGKGNRRKHLLTVVNWGKYQQNETENFTETVPKTLPKINPNVPPNKNDKNEKNEKKIERVKFTAPALPEFTKYFQENGYSPELAKRAFKGYEEADWHDSEGKKVKNWKQKCQHVWFTPGNQQKKQINGCDHSSQIKSIMFDE